MTYITSAGMFCPIGLTAEAACAAYRAGISGFQELPYVHAEGEPVVGAAVSELGPDLEQPGRLVRMLAAAVADCLASEPEAALHELPILVALPERDRPGVPAELGAALLSQLEQELGLTFHRSGSQLLPEGRTAGFSAVRAARELLRAGRAEACLVCAVDSHVAPDALHWLEKHTRLKTADHSDGVIPGEAAAAVLLRARPAPASVRIAGMGFAVESAHLFSGEPLRGLGLASAARDALGEAGVAMHEIALRISDVTPEQYTFKEQALTMARLLKVPVEGIPLWHWADCIGDVGAAAGVCQLVLFLQAVRRGFAPGPWAVCFASAIGGDRAALVLSR